MDENIVKKKNNTLIIVLIAIIVLFLFGLGFVAYNKYFNSNKTNNDTNSSSSNKETSPESNIIKEGQIITLDDVKNDLLAKTASILGFDSLDISTANYIRLREINKDLLVNLKLSEEKKREIALKSVWNTSKVSLTIPKESINNSTYLKIYNKYFADLNDVEYMAQISSTDVEKAYTDLFNENITHGDLNEACPMFYYDSVNSLYYSFNMCGGSDANLALVVLDDLRSDGNEAYVSLYFGYIDEENNKLYGGFDNNVVKTYNENTSYDSDVFNEIVNSYLGHFSKYKFVFKQDISGNYYFDRIEK